MPELLVTNIVVAWSGTLLLLGDAPAGKHLSNFGLVAIALGASIAAAVRSSRTDTASRRTWRLLAAATLAWALGQATWTFYESVLGREVPFPSLADLGYLAFVPLAVAALLALPTSPERLSGRVRTVLDGLLIGASLLFLSWELVLGDVFALGGDAFPLAISIAYPAGDVVIMTLLLFAASRRRDQALGGSTLPLVFAGLMAIAVADSGFVYLTSNGSYSSGSVIDIGWFSGFAVLLLAAVVHRDDPLDEADTRTEGAGERGLVLTPYVPVVIAAAAGAAKLIVDGRLGPFLGATALVLLFLAVLRQVAALLDNAALTSHLEERVVERTAQLERSERRFRSLVQNSSDVIAVVAGDGQIQYLSPAIERVFGHRAADLRHATLFELVAPHQQMAAIAFLESTVRAGGQSITTELGLLRADGSWADAEILGMCLPEDDAGDGIVLNMRDVTERKQLQERLTHQAFHDPLTGLANRALFADRLQHALVQAQRRLRPLAVLYFDLDGFKATNDSLGHEAGDTLLRQVAARLLECSRSGDTVSRWGGDEFGVLIEDLVGDSEATVIAERVIDILREPFVVSGQEVFVAASIGIVVSEIGQESAADLLRYADLAMYRAKADRRGSFCRYEPSMQAGLLARVEMERHLRTAIDRRELTVCFQPFVELATGQLVGVEALARWDRPDHGPISPVEFIPVAESSGLILPLGEFVLREACVAGKEWAERADGPFAMSVNLSARQLQDPGLIAMVAGVLEETGLCPTNLVLELTESMLLDESQTTLAAMQALRKLGIRLAIDDFGTGYSSLSYLHRFPVDILKVDRSFVKPLGTAEGSSLARSIIRIGRELGLKTVAEGVEREEQMEELQRLGCDHGQGFLFSRPITRHELGQLLDETAVTAGRLEPIPAPV